MHLSYVSKVPLGELLTVWEPRDIETLIELLEAEYDAAMEPIRAAKRRELHGLD